MIGARYSVQNCCRPVCVVDYAVIKCIYTFPERKSPPPSIRDPSKMACDVIAATADEFIGNHPKASGSIAGTNAQHAELKRARERSRGHL